MKKFLSLLCFTVCMLVSNAQFNYPSSGNVLLGTTNDEPSALMNIHSTTQGLLIPRMTGAEMTAISAPVKGLLVYNTNMNALYQYDGSEWRVVGIGGEPGIAGINTISGQSYTGFTGTGKLVGSISPGFSGLTTFAGTDQTSNSANGIIDLTQKWNTNGNPTAIRLNIDHQFSGSSSLLLDLQTGGNSQFKVSKSGTVTQTGNIVFTSGGSKLSHINSFLQMSNTAWVFKTDHNGSLGTTHWSFQSGTDVASSGTQVAMSIIGGFSSALYQTEYNALSLNQTINQTGTAAGITRGVYINPTLTSSADWRSIQFTNNAGWGVYGSGNAKNYLKGSLLIGAATDEPTAILQVTSTTKGVLFPRMTTTQRDGISSPATGLEIFNLTTFTKDIYNGTEWVSLSPSAGVWTSNGVNISNSNTGSIYIGLTPPTDVATANAEYKLYVAKGVRTKKVKVDQHTWPDYVFETSYSLPSIATVEAYIKEHRHLQGIPSADEVIKNGIDLGDNQAALLQKIEELTLYIIEQDKKITAQTQEIAVQNKNTAEQQQQIADIHQQLEALKKLVEGKK